MHAHSWPFWLQTLGRVATERAPGISPGRCNLGMTFFPTEAAAAELANLAVRDWVGMSAAVFAAFESVIGDLSNSLRNLALLQPNNVRMAVESARVQPATGDACSLSGDLASGAHLAHLQDEDTQGGWHCLG
eukprot:1773091-Amphidinium_carterae.2